MTNLAILNTSIRTLEGLHSLNDIYKASGTTESYRPSNFIRLEQTKDLIAEIEKDQSSDMSLAQKTFRGGLNAGVWACEELVLAYAMWISPKFHLTVIRAFMQMHNIGKSAVK
ncbi:KilA-N domain-containing protein [Testudinibacter sp. P80/BLE/0925]|uniref:KilA-N domain-containing protein n=1 Tax=Testudinibacter sp. TW-1 TaxID=3417757 RepID=UPI003D363D67